MERCQGVAGNCCRGKILLTAKFCSKHHQENLATGRGQTSKIWLPTQKLGQAQGKGKAPRCGMEALMIRVCHQHNFGTKTKKFKSVKMIVNYGG
jgi:hypothetical protein